MYDFFSSAQSLIKVNSISTENNVFKLHHKVTTLLLIICSLLLTGNQYFGDPIDCFTVNNLDPDMIDTFCWVQGIYNRPDHDGIHPGVGPKINHATKDTHEIKYHKYYQWVTFFLFFQALLFYLPYYLWKVWEGGKVKMLVAGLDAPIVDDSLKQEKKKMLFDYFNINLNRHDIYAYQFFFCEFLNFVNVIGQIYLTDRFLGFEFTNYGSDLLKMKDKEFNFRMDTMFPKVAKCDFIKFGASGTHERHEALCVLPLNILNEKIFIFLWFWFVVLTVITAVSLVFRLITFVPAVRHVLLRVRSRLSSSVTVDVIARKCRIGDWFLLYLIGKNMDPLIYKEFISELGTAMQGKHS